MKYIYNDAGRSAAGYANLVGDCGLRAYCIVADVPYITGAKEMREHLGHDCGDGISMKDYKAFLAEREFIWTPLMKIGTGCRVHLQEDELPEGRLIVRLSKHYAAIIDKVLHDNHNSSITGSCTRCIYGYWRKS